MCCDAHGLPPLTVSLWLSRTRLASTSRWYKRLFGEGVEDGRCGAVELRSFQGPRYRIDLTSLHIKSTLSHHQFVGGAFASPLCALKHLFDQSHISHKTQTLFGRVSSIKSLGNQNTNTLHPGLDPFRNYGGAPAVGTPRPNPRPNPIIPSIRK